MNPEKIVSLNYLMFIRVCIRKICNKLELFQQILYTELASFVRSIQQIQAVVEVEEEVVVEEKRLMEVMEATTMEKKMEEVIYFSCHYIRKLFSKLLFFLFVWIQSWGN